MIYKRLFKKKDDWALTDKQKLKYDYHTKHREYLRDRKHDMEDKFSHLLVYLSTFIFTASILILRIYFFKSYIPVILLSWGFILVSLILVLLSIIFSIKSYNLEIDHWDKHRKDLEKNPFTRIMKILVFIWTIFIIIWIILMFLFYSLNLVDMANDDNIYFTWEDKIEFQKNSEPVRSATSPDDFFSNDENNNSEDSDE